MPKVHENPERGQALLAFLTLAARNDFEQYPRLKEAYAELRASLRALSISEQEEQSFFKLMEVHAHDGETGEDVESIAETIGLAVSTMVDHKLRTLTSADVVRFLELEKALKRTYVRALEVLAVFQKQEREHTASHRAHSSKTAEGFMFEGPELSLEAIETALQRGVKMIELDISSLPDGTLVVSHDASPKSGGATLEELLKRFDAYKGLAKLNIEIKNPNAVDGLLKQLRERGLENDVVVSSFDPHTLLKVHAAMPEVQIGVNSMINEANAMNILSSDPRRTIQLLIAGFAIGGSALPPEGVRYAMYDTLPRELTEMLAKTHGYLCVQMPLAKMGSELSKDQLAGIAEEAARQGFHLLMFRVEPEAAAFLKDSVSLLHLDKGEKLTYPRMGKPLERVRPPGLEPGTPEV